MSGHRIIAVVFVLGHVAFSVLGGWALGKGAAPDSSDAAGESKAG